MKLNRSQQIRTVQFYFCIIVLSLFGHSFVAVGEEKNKATVGETDCSKCHEGIVFLLNLKGEAHKPLCLECHQGHPPADVDIIPSCNRCHSGEDHFTITGCLRCHTNPHSPLEIKFSRNITDACLSCHTSQFEELQSNPSIHTKLACTACHHFHGQLQPCRNCHLPHSDTMDDDSCAICHKAHNPLDVNYGENIVSEDCGSCHVEVYKSMVSNVSKHKNVTCISCHSEKHGTIPACEKCHGRPHPEEILAKFSRCGECHGIAHNLEATAAATSIFTKGRE